MIVVPTDRHFPTIDQLLAAAAVPLDGMFSDDDVADWCAIATAAYNAPRLDLKTDVADEQPGRSGKPEMVAAPAIYHSEHEQAAHDLNLAVAVIISTPQAAGTLRQVLAGPETLDHEGALVLACLLYLIGNTDGAVFWWRFAADDIKQAAFCLELHHRSHAEYRDAEHWRKQSRKVSSDGIPITQKGEHADHAPVARSVRRSLLDLCRRNRRPQLPRAMEEVLSKAVTSHDARNPLAFSWISNPLEAAL